MSEQSAKLLKPASLLTAVVLLMVLTGCTLLFPNTAAAIEPQGATLEEAAVGLLADVEMWISTVGGWIAYLFGG